MRTPLAFGLAALVALTGCEEKSSKMTLGGNQDAGACDLGLDSLAGKDFVYLELKPDKSEVPTHKSRIRFFEEEGTLKAKYNVGSVADMYTYECRMSSGGDKLICGEKPKVKDWCQAMLVGGSDCELATLQTIEKSLTAEDIAEGVKEATENVAKYKDKPEWESFKLNNNNLGNKLRGILYVKVNDKKCQLTVTDNYLTIYNGKKREDSNPNGTNPFVKNELGELLWEHCTNRQDLVALDSATYPEDPQKVAHVARQEAGKPVNFWFLAGDVQAPIEGCGFTYDTFYDGKPGDAGLSPKASEDGTRLEWHFAKNFALPSENGLGNAVTAVISGKCDDPKKLGEGWKDGKRVVCAGVLVE